MPQYSHIASKFAVTWKDTQKLDIRSIEFMSAKMSCQLCLLQFALAELFVHVSCSGNITLADRYGLLAALLQDSLTEEDQRSIDRILYGIRKGRLRVVNEISVVR